MRLSTEDFSFPSSCCCRTTERAENAGLAHCGVMSANKYFRKRSVHSLEYYLLTSMTSEYVGITWHQKTLDLSTTAFLKVVNITLKDVGLIHYNIIWGLLSRLLLTERVYTFFQALDGNLQTLLTSDVPLQTPELLPPWIGRRAV